MKIKLTKYFSILLVTLLLIFSGVTAFSAEEGGADEYHIDQLCINLTIPRSFGEVTQNNIDLGDNYANVITSSNDSVDFTVDALSNEKSQKIFNYKYLSEKELKNIAADMAKDKAISNCTIKELGDVLFITYLQNTAENGQTVYSVCAQTVLNGNNILLKLSSVNDQLTVAEKGYFNNIIDSINVTQIFNRPAEVNIGEIFRISFMLVFTAAVIVLIILIIYYKKNGDLSGNNVDTNMGKEAASKYFDELQKDGMIFETMQIDKVKLHNEPEKSKPLPAPVTAPPETIEFVTYHKGVKTVVATVDNWKQMSLSKEEWEEKNQQDLLPEKELKSEEMFIFNDGMGPLFDGPEEKIERSNIKRNESGIEISRNNNDDLDEYSEGFSIDVSLDEADVKAEKTKKSGFMDMFRKEKSSSVQDAFNEKSTNAFEVSQNENAEENEFEKIVPTRENAVRKTPRRESVKVEQDLVLKEFENDSYWDKYR